MYIVNHFYFIMFSVVIIRCIEYCGIGGGKEICKMKWLIFVSGQVGL